MDGRSCVGHLPQPGKEDPHFHTHSYAWSSNQPFDANSPPDETYTVGHTESSDCLGWTSTSLILPRPLTALERQHAEFFIACAGELPLLSSASYEELLAVAARLVRVLLSVCVLAVCVLALLLPLWCN